MINTHLQSQFLALYNSHKGIVHKAINTYLDNKELEEDITQEIVLNAWKYYHTFRGDAKFSTWLFNVSRGTILSYIKKSCNKIKHLSLDNLQSLVALPVDKNYCSIINDLSDKERKVFILYLEGYSFKEIGELMDEPEPRLRVRISRIKSDLRKKIKKDFL